jgi:glucosamine-6-phosphate deaminase
MSDCTLPSPATQVTNVGNLSLRVAPTAVDMTQDVAVMVQDYLQSLLKQQETVRIILATGNSQLDFLREIAQGHQLDWSRIICFHLDEYLGIAAEHPGSFHSYLHHKVELPLQPRKFHYLVGDAPEPLKECDRYRHLLQQQTIDLCMLGIGDNGHLAFNEPTVADFNDPQLVKLIKLETKTRQQQVNGGYFPDLASVPNYAYTLTIPAICAAKRVFCLAGGSHKREVVRQALENEIAPNFPATILRTLPHATLFGDLDSCSDYL